MILPASPSDGPVILQREQAGSKRQRYVLSPHHSSTFTPGRISQE
jgi:hypothetical protein